MKNYRYPDTDITAVEKYANITDMEKYADMTDIEKYADMTDMENYTDTYDPASRSTQTFTAHMCDEYTGYEWIDREIAEVIAELIACGRFAREADYIQHGDTSVYSHSVNVAMISMHIAMKLAALNIVMDERSLIRGALLHDYFLYDWHEADAGHDMHGFTHPYTALKNAEADYELNDIERNIIKRHMFPLIPIPPATFEGWTVCIADKISATKETAAPIILYLSAVRKMPHRAYAYLASMLGIAA